ncbi:MAG: hybrid sensor histidine kinase/response regulator [Nitrospinota bacterium]|nr:hybrid sensor histidine kinase/response regulator [Nitrospinota bacterium]
MPLDKNDRITAETEFRLVASNYFSEVKASLLRETIQSINKVQAEIKREVEAHKVAREELIIEKNRAEAATLLKDKFVSLVAHDLRSPFTSILGILKMVLKDADDPVTEKQREKIMRVLENGENLIKIIENILDVSKLKTGEIEPQRVFSIVRHLAESVIRKHLETAERKGITLFNDLPQNKRIYVDPVLFEEVLSNLVNNAIKFSNEGCVIRIFSGNEEKTEIIVSDTGIGIPPDQISKIFNPEIRMSSKGTAGESGTGLGLSFCLDIIKAHDGNIKVESVEGAGSIFHIELPDVLPQAVLLAVRGDTYEAYKDAMTAHGMTVVDAEKYSIEENYHIAVVDADTENGFDFIRKLKTAQKFGNNPIIVVATEKNGEAKEKARDCGVRTFLEKPVSVEELLKRIQGTIP